MSRLLRIDTNPGVKTALVRSLADHFVDQCRRNGRHLEVTERDLVTDPPGLILTGEDVQSLYADPAILSRALRNRSEQSDAYIRELQQADELLIATPMHNHTVPAPLKAWIDLVVRPRFTFEYTPDGPVGLLKNKRALVICTIGGDYSTGPEKAHDFLRPYLRSILGFIGIEEVTMVSAEGIAISPSHREEAIEDAHRQLSELARNW